MPDVITTKPMRSQAQWRFLFAADMPFARRWARATPGGKGKRFQQLPVKVTTKAPNYNAKRGQVIAGRLRRGNSGKFESTGAAPTTSAGRLNAARDAARAQPPKKAPPAAAGCGRKPPKPKKTPLTPEQRAAVNQAKRAQNRADVLGKLGIAPDGQAALDALRQGQPPDAAAIDRAGLVKAGLAEQAADGSYRLTSSGRATLAAADAGDAGRAGDTISAARDRTGARTQRQDAATQRRAAAEAKRRAAAQQPKGGGGKKQPPKVVRRTPTRSSARPTPVSGGRSASAPPQPKASPYAALAQRVSDGQPISAADADALVRNGLARRARDGSLSLTAGGRRATEKAHAFLVLKDATGAHRWVAYSSNAYRDRDHEIVSTKALADDCARADGDGQYGPLRWWHVGGMVAPGWDLGTCDFNAMHGRVLVESGTFKSAAIGQAVAKAAPNLQLSIGFTHAPDEPDRQGVFHHIRRFERSLVPSGRAANPFTRLIVKETHMEPEKEAALKTHLGDDVAAQVIAGAETVQKEADDVKTAYKADDPWAAVLTALKGAVAEMIAPPPVVESVAEKAPPPAMDAEDDPAQGGDMGADEPAEGEPPLDAGGGERSADEFLAQIGDLLDTKFAPLIDALGITQKLDGHLGELKTMLGGYQAKKDDADAARQQEIATLKATNAELKERVAALEGDVPNAFRQAFGGYRPSQAAETVVTKDQAPGGAPPPPVGTPTDDDPFADIKAGLFGGSQNGRA